MLNGLISAVSGIIKSRKVTAIVLAAGSSERMQGENKIFAEICGKPTVYYSVKCLSDCSDVDEIIIVTKKDSLERMKQLVIDEKLFKVKKVVVGGSTRTESSIKGIEAVSANTRTVLIHDAARPCIKKTFVSEMIAAAVKYSAAVPGLNVTGTLKRTNGGKVLETVSRENVIEVQTPQAFDFDLIRSALKSAAKQDSPITDDCMAIEAIGIKPYVVNGLKMNIKITYPEDIKLAELYIGSGELY